jgi:hypothetical protein
MFFHMLRQQVGDKTFVQALQDFYQKNAFQFASFDDLRQSFEGVSGEEMNVYFNQWLTRTGAPELKVSRAKSRADGDGFVLTAVLEQTQPEGVYPLRIPVAVTMEGQDRALQTVIAMEKRRLELKLRLPARPLRLDVDPEFDLFRRLDRDEIPPALTQTFGAKKMLILLPSSSGKSLLHAYRELSQSLAHSGPDEVEVKLDTEVKLLPSDRAVVLLGWQNHFLSEMASALSEYDVAIKQNELYIGSKEIRRENHSVVLTARLPENKDISLTWVAADLPDALPGLGRKLPHYHKYSYLGFQGPEPTNIAKGRWPALDTPMTSFVAREDGATLRVERAKLTRREPLTNTLKPDYQVESAPKKMRKVSLGIIPDFTYGGEGCRLSGVVPDSPAESSGLREGDVIVRIGSNAVHNTQLLLAAVTWTEVYIEAPCSQLQGIFEML